MLDIYLEKNRAIRYLYDANGNKLRKIVFGENGHIEYIRDYSGSFVYTDGAIDFVLTEEGRVNKEGDEFRYEYFLKDHLGNTRVSFEVDNGIVNTTAETHYYPFGMTLHGLNQPLRHHRDPVKSQYLYNGKELQSDNGLEWYDYGARFYDAQLGRWTTPDPLSERNYRLSSYSFVANGPIINIDPDGKDYYKVTDKGVVLVARTNQKFHTLINGNGEVIWRSNNEYLKKGTDLKTGFKNYYFWKAVAQIMMARMNKSVYQDMLMRAKTLGFRTDIEKLEIIELVNSTAHRDENYVESIGNIFKLIKYTIKGNIEDRNEKEGQKQKEENQKKKKKFRKLTNDYYNLREGTYSWNGNEWVYTNNK